MLISINHFIYHSQFILYLINSKPIPNKIIVPICVFTVKETVESTERQHCTGRHISSKPDSTDFLVVCLKTVYSQSAGAASPNWLRRTPAKNEDEEAGECIQHNQPKVTEDEEFLEEIATDTQYNHSNFSDSDDVATLSSTENEEDDDEDIGDNDSFCSGLLNLRTSPLPSCMFSRVFYNWCCTLWLLFE